MNNSNTEPWNVLAVEDSQLAVEQIREILRNYSARIQIEVAQSPADAVEVARKLLPQVVILDLQLKQGTGFTVLKELKDMEPRPTFIVLTNYALPPYREYALLTGADYFLDKAKDMDKVCAIFDLISLTKDRAPNNTLPGQ